MKTPGRALAIALAAATGLSAFVPTADPARAQTPGCLKAKTVAAGAHHSLLVDRWSSVWVWGDNTFGQLGDGTTTTSSIPTMLTSVNDVIAVAAGTSHSLALKRDGTVWAWGANTEGQLGNGTTVDSLTPVQVLGLSGINAIAAGADHSIGRGSDNLLRTWGNNSQGQLGIGTTVDSPIAALLPALGPILQFAAGANHSLALRVDYTVSAWGSNSSGQLGNATFADSTTPTEVVGLRDIRAIGSGSYHSLARRDGGTVWAWGDNSHGQLGTLGPGSNVPVNSTFVGPIDDTVNWLYYGVDLNLIDPIDVVTGGGNHSAALSANRSRAWTWGGNSSGQLGYGTTSDSPVPTKLAGHWRVISLGEAHTLVVGVDDSVGSTGDNSRGQLGNATLTNRGTLTPIGCPLAGSPSQPLNAVATASDGSATVRWDPPTSQGSSPITSYTINSSGKQRVVVTATNSGAVPTEATVAGLINGQSYSFTVHATNSQGFGAKSTSSNAIVPRLVVPTAPRNVLASPSDSSATVSWSPPLNEGASPVTSYTATASPGGSWLTISGSTATFTGLTNGTTYVFAVVANNSYGNSASSFSPPVIASKIPDTPTQVVAEAGDGLAIVRWIPGYHGGAPVTSVKVTASPGGQSIDVKCGISSVTFTGLTNGTAYNFSVVGTNQAGASLPGETTSPVTPIRNAQLLGFYTDGAKTRYGDLTAPSPADKEVILRGVGTAWLDFDLRSKPIFEQQPGLTSYKGTWDWWPDVSSSCTPLTDMSIQAMSDWGVNIVRVPMSSTFWGSDSAQNEFGCQAPFPSYRQNVDAVVASITARGMVALLDLHSLKRIPCSPDWNRLHPMADSSAIAFWESVSRRYLTNPLVAFELFNEPHTHYLNYGHGPWALWLHGGSVISCPTLPSYQGTCPGGDGAQWTAAGMQEMYNAIRTVENTSITPIRHLVFVGGNMIARQAPPAEYMLRDPDGALARNLVYVAHYYSGASRLVDGRYHTIPGCAPSTSIPSGCFSDWAAFSNTYSVAVNVTEFGWNEGPETDQYSPTYPKPAGQQQNENVICSATNANMGWTVYRWSSDHDHTPTIPQYYGIIAGQDQTLPTLTPNASGVPIKDALTIDPSLNGGKRSLAIKLGCSYIP